MKYRLLKDLPFAKAGEVFERVTYKSKNGLSDYDYLKISKRLKDGEDESMFTIDYGYFLGNFSEWFEGFQEGSVHWKPQLGYIYWCIDSDGEIIERRWTQGEINEYDYLSGNIYRELDEIEQARERKLAEIRLRRTSTFEPDFENGKGGYIVNYDYINQKLECCDLLWNDSGEIVRYATREDAKKSIKENREDWLIYFGVKE